jgi:ribokinase
MAGSVGSDVFADRVVEELRARGVKTNDVQKSEGPTGTASIYVLPNGENAIVISAGANGHVDVEFARKAVQNMEAGDLLLCQLEIPLDAVTAAMQAAYERGVITLLDPAPARELPDDLLRHSTILTPNQTEAAILLGNSRAIETLEDGEMAAHKLQTRGPATVIAKMGKLGCVVATETAAWTEHAFEVSAVDTTAAGDAFNGALAAELARGGTLKHAVSFANAAAALSVAKPGAIASLPGPAELREFMVRRSSK